MRRIALLLGLAALLLVANGVLATSRTRAASSAGYKLAWFTPLTGSGGGRMASANYVADITVGQAAMGGMASASYGACLGYWCGIDTYPCTVYLPLVVRA